jgi:hypothetical protein
LRIAQTIVQAFFGLYSAAPGLRHDTLAMALGSQQNVEDRDFDPQLGEFISKNTADFAKAKDRYSLNGFRRHLFGHV